MKSFVFDECVAINNLQWPEKNPDNEPYIMWNYQALHMEPVIWAISISIIIVITMQVWLFINMVEIMKHITKANKKDQQW